jgi:hypothetical protein
MARISLKIPTSSIVIFVVVLAAILGLILVTHGSVVSLGLRWAVTGVYIVATVILGIRDFGSDSGSDDRDATPFDRWTSIHAGAGVVFGVWYVPLVFVLLITIGWEVFEKLAPGFGDTEVILNRAVDVGSAVVVWLIVVGLVILIAGAPFPLLSSPR